MPELPEVETTKRGLIPYLVNQTITAVKIYQTALRQPLNPKLPEILSNKKIISLQRIAKYLLINFEHGSLIIHLGMSGSLRIVENNNQRKKHDHCLFQLNHDYWLHYHDPRKFGLIIWTVDSPLKHPLLASLGIEPLTDAFTANYLYQLAKNKSCAIKNFIMDSHVVVGIGNIYANEALFYAGIHPNRSANKISLKRYEILVTHIKNILTKAIDAGGSTLRDFVSGTNNPGYFQFEFAVYGREGKACMQCEKPLLAIKIAQRTSVYCSICQR